MPDELPARIGARLRRLREKQGLSQGQVAARAGTYRELVGAIERGERGVPQIATLQRLCRAMRVRLRDVLVVMDTDPRWDIERGCWA